MKERIVPIQFQEKIVNEIEVYIKEGLYASKAEFVREAVRNLIIELRRQLFWTRVEKLKKKLKDKGIIIKSPFVPEKIREEAFEEVKKRVIERENKKS